MNTIIYYKIIFNFYNITYYNIALNQKNTKNNKHNMPIVFINFLGLNKVTFTQI